MRRSERPHGYGAVDESSERSGCHCRHRTDGPVHAAHTRVRATRQTPGVKILSGSELYIEGKPQFPGRIRGVGAAEEGGAERADEIHEVRVVESVEYINANFNELR